MLSQIIFCALLLPLLFNVPLEMARMAHDTQQLSTQLSQHESAVTVKKAVEIADFLLMWRNVLPFAIAFISVVGTLVGLIGWQALKQKENMPMNNGIKPTC